MPSVSKRGACNLFLLSPSFKPSATRPLEEYSATAISSYSCLVLAM
eukprot:CAMPEP_0172087758 /NCGR_PEP_ID=MMETSP1043-20130122/22859_1 /TAXON_ID=464988 /ORGANISM="Hemiselmis andersenii, Strain CCMP441" /LENGTH=45 /DNA_ID= /DNA_START= /DNA_END= /DNA_ORIENTATION=